jgi:hypothetical protein
VQYKQGSKKIRRYEACRVFEHCTIARRKKTRACRKRALKLPYACTMLYTIPKPHFITEQFI